MDNFDFDSSADLIPDGSSSSRWGKRPESRGARIFGIVMVVAAILWPIASVNIWYTEMARMKSLGDFSDPYYYFVNPFELTGGLALIGSLQGFAGILLCLGTYRIIYSRKSTALVFIVFPIFFGLIIAQAFHVSGIREEVQKSAISNQHTWAEQRYGLTYDEITVKTLKANESRTYKAQDSVMKDGQVIASVCEAENRQSTYFCEPGTATELSTGAYSPPGSEGILEDTSTLDESSTDYSENNG